MRTATAMMMATMAACAATDATGQQVLDRVDPTRVEATTPPPPKTLDDTAVALPAAPPATASAGTSVTVGAIVIEGLSALRPGDFADIVEAHVGRTLSPTELATLADRLAERARLRGYVFPSATIAPQTVTAGVLRVTLDEGRIAEVRQVGMTNTAVAAALAGLVGDRPVTIAELERSLLIAGDVDGVWLRRTRLLREGGRNVLLVDVAIDSATAWVGLQNDGSLPIGPLQLDATVRLSQVLAADDLVTFSAVVTPVDLREYAYARVRYGKRVSADGTEINLGASISDTYPGAYLRRRDIEGRSWSANVGVLHPIERRRDHSLWLEGSLNLRTVRQERADVLARRDRLAVARLGVYGFTTMFGGRLRANATLSQGLDVLDATRADDRLASRDDADGTFTTGAVFAEWDGRLIDRVSLRVAASTQVAFQPLLVSEEVGLGGGRFLRGYDYSERSGDEGTMGSAEIRYMPVDKLGPLARPELYAFVDGGRVTNLSDGSGTGTLFSTGGGIRSSIFKSMSADLGLAFPLSGERYDTDSAAPVINFRLARRF